MAWYFGYPCIELDDGRFQPTASRKSTYKLRNFRAPAEGFQRITRPRLVDGRLKVSGAAGNNSEMVTRRVSDSRWSHGGAEIEIRS
ncbi:hypothetical protein CASFOL_034316 [Castilleja foliolosa]|uniref:Uncharacterized protein n=1 Tax=Castilleja foliolosa TaxID=1961234 RepID=A0ABD3BWD0_9LAMI